MCQAALLYALQEVEKVPECHHDLPSEKRCSVGEPAQRGKAGYNISFLPFKSNFSFLNPKLNPCFYLLNHFWVYNLLNPSKVGEC